MRNVGTALNRAWSRWCGRLALVSLMAFTPTASAQTVSAPSNGVKRVAPPELRVPPTSQSIPPAAVIVSDSPVAPTEVPVPTLGVARVGAPPQGTAVTPASSTQALDARPTAASANRYAPAGNRATPLPAAGVESAFQAGPASSPAVAVSDEAPGSLVAPRTLESTQPLPVVTGPTPLAGGARSVLAGPKNLPTQQTPSAFQVEATGQSAPRQVQPEAVLNPYTARENPATLEPTPSADLAGNEKEDGAQPVPASDHPLGYGAPSSAPAEEAPLPGALSPVAPLPTDASSGKLTPVAAPTEEGSQPAAQAEYAPATFREVEPGVTTLDQVLTAWGEPVEQSGEGGERALLYKMAPFAGVQVRASEGVVESIVIQLAGALTPEVLAERLQLEFIRPVEVRDAQGVSLGRAFPERGVLFSYLPDVKEPMVAQVLLEAIDPQAFYLRAETTWRGHAAASLSDLNYVVEKQPNDAAAFHLLARIHLSLDQVDEALAAIERARELDTEESDYRLTRAACLMQRGDMPAAEEELASVQAAVGVSPLLKSRSLLLLGNLMTQGARRDFKSAIKLHMEAIRLAEPLTTDPLIATRRKAKEAFIEATLAVASDIAWGNWNRKEEVVPKWIEKADACAREAMAQDGAGVELRLLVIERALAAHAGFKPAVDPERFLEVATELTRKLTEATDDPLAQQAADWELGRVYNHAVRLAHLRSTVEEGFKYGQIAQEKLENAAAGRGSSWRARNELGRLYFHVGVLEAVHRQDHEKAVDWYDRAYELLAAEDNIKAEEPGQLGEMLVSMGVSYWQVDLKQKGLEITTLGAQLVKQGVEQGTLAADALTVPYGNLASMHAELGQPEKAREMELTAEKLQQSQLK